MLEETGEKIFCLSQDTGKQSGNISTPEQAYMDTCNLNAGSNPVMD